MSRFTPAWRRLCLSLWLSLVPSLLPAQTPPESHFARGVECLEAGQPVEALRSLQRARELARGRTDLLAAIDKTMAAAHALRGQELYRTGALEQAADNYAAAQRLCPGRVGVLQSLAVIRLQQGRHNAAKDLATSVLGIDPQNASALQVLASLAKAEDDIQQTSRWLDRATAADPERTDLAAAAKAASRHAAVERGFVRKSTASFVFQYPPGRDHGIESGLNAIQGTLEQVHRELCQRLAFRPTQPLVVVVYAPEQFEAVNGRHQRATAFYDGKLRIPYDRAKGPANPELRNNLRHEITHAFLFELAGKNVPAWVHEGLAQVIEGRSVAAVTERFAAGLQMLPLPVFCGDFAGSPHASVVRRGYEQSLLAVGHLLRRGHRPFQSFLVALGRGLTADEALRQVYRLDVEKLLDAAIR